MPSTSSYLALNTSLFLNEALVTTNSLKLTYYPFHRIYKPEWENPVMKTLNLTKKLQISILILLSSLFIGCATQTTEPTQVNATNHVSTEDIVKMEAQLAKIIDELPTDKSTVYFKFDSSRLSSLAKTKISTHIEFLKNNPSYTITLEGHTDSRGDEQYNEALGSSRAEVIKELLLAQNISEDKIKLVSYGENKPAMKGENENAWRSNRRAMFVYNKIDG